MATKKTNPCQSTFPSRITGETNETLTLIATIKSTATDLLTIDEATKALEISRPTLWRRVRSGNVSVRQGGRRLVQLPARQ